MKHISVELQISIVNQYSLHLQGWAKTKPSREYNCFKKLFDGSYQRCITMVKSRLMPKMALTEANYVRQTRDILDGLLEMFPEGQYLPRLI